MAYIPSQYILPTIMGSTQTGQDVTNLLENNVLLDAYNKYNQTMARGSSDKQSGKANSNPNIGIANSPTVKDLTSWIFNSPDVQLSSDNNSLIIGNDVIPMNNRNPIDPGNPKTTMQGVPNSAEILRQEDRKINPIIARMLKSDNPIIAKTGNFAYHTGNVIDKTGQYLGSPEGARLLADLGTALAPSGSSAERLGLVAQQMTRSRSSDYLMSELIAGTPIEQIDKSKLGGLHDDEFQGVTEAAMRIRSLGQDEKYKEESMNMRKQEIALRQNMFELSGKEYELSKHRVVPGVGVVNIETGETVKAFNSNDNSIDQLNAIATLQSKMQNMSLNQEDRVQKQALESLAQKYPNGVSFDATKQMYVFNPNLPSNAATEYNMDVLARLDVNGLRESTTFKSFVSGSQNTDSPIYLAQDNNGNTVKDEKGNDIYAINVITTEAPDGKKLKKPREDMYLLINGVWRLGK